MEIKTIKKALLYHYGHRHTSMSIQTCWDAKARNIIPFKFEWSIGNRTGFLKVEPNRFVITEHYGRCLQLAGNIDRKLIKEN